MLALLCNLMPSSEPRQAISTLKEVGCNNFARWKSNEIVMRLLAISWRQLLESPYPR